MIRLKGQGWGSIRTIETWLFSKGVTRSWYIYRMLLIGLPIKQKSGGAFTPPRQVQHKATISIGWPIKCGPWVFFLSFFFDYDSRWSVCISKCQRSLCVSFSRRESGLCIYHLYVWSNFNFLHNSQWITLAIQRCLV